MEKRKTSADKRRRLRVVFILVAVLFWLYVLSYAYFRQTHTEVWERDGRAYVIFPTDKIYLYYLYRPLSYADGKLTGMGFHIGPHQ